MKNRFSWLTIAFFLGVFSVSASAQVVATINTNGAAYQVIPAIQSSSQQTDYLERARMAHGAAGIRRNLDGGIMSSPLRSGATFRITVNMGQTKTAAELERIECGRSIDHR